MQAINRKSTYRWYLTTAFWRERREEAFRNANHMCEDCSQLPATQVHHLTYLRIFRELPSDLVALCDDCHRKRHLLEAANDNQLVLDSFPMTIKNNNEAA